MKTILITGGAGFLGSHLCDALVKNNKVICVDNLFTGSESNIKHLMDNKNFKFVKHDIIEPLVLDDKKIDQIYNFAIQKGAIGGKLLGAGGGGFFLFYVPRPDL